MGDASGMRPDDHPATEETEITGAWVLADGRVVANADCRRIERLTTGYMEKVAGGGWTTLFRDGRLWELDYPQSEMHGGGPPRLRSITEADASARYTML
jgi:hypothetical protein